MATNLNPRTKSWLPLLAQVHAAGWPVPSRVANMLAKAEKVEQLAADLPKPSPRANDRELAARMVETGETVAVIRAEDDAEAARDATRRAWEVLSAYRSTLTGNALTKAIRDDAEQLLTVAADAAAETIEQARPHVEQLARFADRGYPHADVLARGTDVERDAAHAVERLESTFALAVNLWTQTARTALANSAARTSGMSADLGGGGAWTHPERVDRGALDDPSALRLIEAVASPGGFSLPRTFADLKARHQAGERARRRLMSGDIPHVPDVLDVDPSTISDGASRTFAGVDA